MAHPTSTVPASARRTRRGPTCVWYCDPTAPLTTRWKQFLSKDGLGDDSAYALVVDKQGRVWAGTLNHGVSVWNGKEWKNYGVLDGPLGERVFDIAVCPTDGDVWIATNAGLTRYSIKEDSWSYLTRAEGLPSDQVQAIAFDKDGNIVLGTQRDGVALAQSADGYKTWRVVKGPDQMPLTATGKGLPSSLINDVIVAADGTVYAATTTGLAWSSDGGANWRYVRGQDYAAKVQGLYGGAPAGWKETGKPSELLAEDYVTCLAEDGANRLLVGHWVAGSEIVETDAAKGGVKAVTQRENSGYVKAILPLVDAKPLLARYDEGISQAFASASSARPLRAEAGTLPSRPTPTTFPSLAGVPSGDELKHLLDLVRNRTQTPEATSVVPLPDDWTTQGDWRGRYGKYWVNLCAMLSPRDYQWGAGKDPVNFAARIGPNVTKDDQLRYWIHSLYTDNRRSLEMPTIYFHSRLVKKLTPWPNDPEKQLHRRQSEWDDHGEAYPMTQEGPDVNVTIRIPAGLYGLSLYNHNKDGDSGFNRARDYKISIRPHDPEKPLYDISGFDSQPELVQGRWRDFRGGNYKRYLVRGPRDLTIQVNRNYSFNTLLAGLFLDEVSEEPSPYFSNPAPDFKALKWSPAPNSEAKEDIAAEELWAALETSKTQDPLWWGSEGRLFYQALARHYQGAQKRTAAEQSNALWSRLGTCFHQLNLFPQWETMQEKRGLKTARAIEKSLEWDHKSSFNGQGQQTLLKALSK